MLNQTHLQWHVRLQNQQQTTYLDLSGRNLTDQQLKCLFNYKWQHLKTIKFTSNKISTNGITNIITMKCNLNLKQLDLSHNLIDSEGLAILSQVVWEKLENLNLGANKIVQVKWVAKNFYNVKLLYLGGNQIVQFPQDIIELKSIENLNICGNKVSSIPQTLLQLNKLKGLDLRGNKLQQSAIALIIQLRLKCGVQV